MKELVWFEFENRADEFCFMMMLRLVSSMCQGGQRVYHRYTEIERIQSLLLEAIEDEGNHKRIRYEAYRALVSLLENNKGAFRILNSKIKDQKLNMTWFSLIHLYTQLTDFKLRVHPSTNMSAQMDFLLTAQRRGLMHSSQKAMTNFKAQLFQDIENKEEQERVTKGKSNATKDTKARKELEKSNDAAFDLMKRLFEQELEWTQMSLAFNPLWPTFKTICSTTKSHFMFFHDLLKNVRKLGNGDPSYDNWARDKCFEVTCSKDFKREILFSLIVDEGIMLETNRMLGDIGVLPKQEDAYGVFFKEIYKEILQRTGQQIVRENIIQATGVFMVYIKLGHTKIKKNSGAKKAMKDILKSYLIAKKPTKGQPLELSQGEWIHCCFLLMSTVENDCCNSDFQKKLYIQLIDAYNNRFELWPNDEEFQKLYTGVFAEFMAVATYKSQKMLDGVTKGQQIENFFSDIQIGFGTLNLAQSIYKPIRIVNALVTLLKDKK